MELRHARYFVAVAEELHFGRAARRLHIAQPPLSQQIRQLEEEIGTKLFDRSSHKVELTPAGKLFLVEARKLLEQAETAIRVAARAGRGETGTLTIGAVDTAIHSVLPDIMKRFGAAFPQVEYRVREINTHDQKCALVEGTIDAGLGYARYEDPHLESRLIVSEKLMLAVSENHPLANRNSITLDSLADEEFIFPDRTESPVLHDMLLAFCQERNVVPRIAQRASSVYMALNMVSLGVGIGLFPESVKALNWNGVTLKKLKGSTAAIELFVSWRRSDECAMVVNFLASAFGKKGGSA